MFDGEKHSNTPNVDAILKGKLDGEMLHGQPQPTEPRHEVQGDGKDVASWKHDRGAKQAGSSIAVVDKNDLQG